MLQRERVIGKGLCFHQVLLLLETASLFQGTNYIFYSFSVQKGMVLEH